VFLLRCVFWLGVVYASMWCGSGALHHHGSFARAVAAQAGAHPQADAAGPDLTAGVERAAGAVSTFCQRHAAECLKDAAAMTALVQTALKTDPEDSIVQDGEDALMSMPTPRSGAR
jgi:hypothetical protein